MKIKDVDNVCIVDIVGKTISKSDIIELKKLFKRKAGERRIGINIGDSLCVGHDFFELLQDTSKINKLSLFNINNEMYLLLYVLKQDIYADIYLNEEDFKNDRRSIVYRRLKVLRAA